MGGENVYLRCPYCTRNEGNKFPKSLGKFRIRTAPRNGLVLKCLRCACVFRLSYIGVPLLWDDMTMVEKRSFTVKEWTKERMKK